MLDLVTHPYVRVDQIIFEELKTKKTNKSKGYWERMLMRLSPPVYR